MSRPNFFIVGAPKCGTTSMYHYLRSHPNIFMPYNKERFWKTKEPNFFADDLGMTSKVRMESEHEYLALFQAVTNETAVGEASPFYLYSESAALRIKEECPTAKIIIMLRPQSDLLLSWHKDGLRFGHENIVDLSKAIEADEARKKGQQIPPHCAYPPLMVYRKIGSYLTHVRRYQEMFGESQVRIFLLEDLHNNPAQIYQETVDFLEVDSAYQPDFQIHNKGVDSSQGDVQGQQIKLLILNKIRPIFEIFRRLPQTQQEQIRALFKLALPKSSAPEIDPEFIHNLQQSYSDDVDQLSHMLKRDLSHWCQP